MLPHDSLQPREYQQRIAQSALKSNTLVVLPTGLGKTVIAVLVARSRLENFEKGKVLVLAPTRPLSLQHYNTFKNTLSIPEHDLSLLTGESNPEHRAYDWERSRFIFATPQTIRNDVRAGRTNLKDVVLMVFDEAHRCVRDYSYTELAKTYVETAEQPLILGLTASPGASRERLNEITRNLSIKKVEARSEEDEDVKPYVEKTNLEGIRVQLPEEYSRLLQAVRELYSEKVKKLTDAGFLPKGRLSKTILLQSRTSMLARLKSPQAGRAGKGYIFGSLINQAQAVMVLHAVELLETQGIFVLERYLSRLREKRQQGKATTSLLRDERWLFVEEEASKLRDHEHPKLDKLASIVTEQLSTKTDSKIIVFTQYRDTIDAILEKLGKLGLRGHRFVGQADKAGSEGMDQRTQSEVLERFRDGDFSVLVSSSIGEEGLHVPDVDLVVFYEAVPSEIRSIQRKGRTGRTRPGRVIILIAEGTIDEAYYYSSISKEKRMRSLVSEEPRVYGRKRAKKNPTLLDFIDR
ncbi:MAG: DEAD/DEAH box helicase [Thaumarchaeota archaeon]|nr:DEAD/DEAH box helicase [Nitrososphaerota archaeon]